MTTTIDAVRALHLENAELRRKLDQAGLTPPAITGYRPLESVEVKRINQIKDLEKELADICKDLDTLAGADRNAGRWAALARTYWEIGFMFAVKALARPTVSIGIKNDGGV